jgi:predicted nucleotidyltransferase
MHFDLAKHTILKVVHGSNLYGTNMPGSDIDYKGVAVSPMHMYLGVSETFEQAEKYENKGADCDEVIYDIRKYCKLAMGANPTILETLFIPESCIVELKEPGKILLENANAFLSQKAFHTHHGFAYSQMRRLHNHKAWMRNPPSRSPTREEFGLSDNNKIKGSDLGIINMLMESGHSISGALNDLLNKEKAYGAAKKNWDQYCDWKKNRNPERYVLEERYGYDLKFAVHIIRLYMNCLEILEKQTLHARRPPEDLEVLLAIRYGKYTYDQFLEMSEKYQLLCENAKKCTTLKHAPDGAQIDFICQKTIESFYEEKR